ncbi:MAG: NADH:ubiquinone reductase (Na(+)-transporting) subunit F [Desulfonatronovibrionaceae bacterium]
MFLSIIIALAFLAATTITLSILLLLAEKLILNYGPCTIDINQEARILRLEGGSSLLSSLSAHQVFIPSACGGRGSCAYCKVQVLDGGGPVSPIEEPYLSAEELNQGIRLSCQVKVRKDIKIQIPEELFLASRFRARLDSRRMLTYDILELDIELVEPETIDFTAGQYIQLESQKYKGRDSVIRAYSLASVPEDNKRIQLIMRRVPQGICTTWAFDHLKPGQELYFSGPYGDFHLQNSGAPAVFIAGGSGMAPIWSILRNMNLENDPRKSIYFFSGRNQDDLFFTDELFQLENLLPDFRYVPCLTREPADSDWTGVRKRIPEILPEYIPDAREYEAYLCGSPALIEACCLRLSELGLKEDRMFFDKFE